MRVLFPFSKNDVAGSGIAKFLSEYIDSELSSSCEIKGFEKSVVEFDFLEDFKEFDVFVVLSKHRSEAEIPCLTVHHTGNLTSQAQLGGKPEELSVSFPRLAGFLLKEIYKKSQTLGLLKEIRVSYEATHHGPSNLTKPIVFIEIGSTMKEWVREDLHKLMAEVAFEACKALSRGSLPECEKSVGFGGGHYSERHTNLTIEKNVCFGHIVPKYAIRQGISDSVYQQLFSKNFEGIDSVYVEKKVANKQLKDKIEKEASKRLLKVVYF